MRTSSQRSTRLRLQSGDLAQQKVDSEVKRGQNLLKNLNTVNKCLWTNSIAEDIPVPIPKFKVQEFLAVEQRSRLHSRLDKIASKMANKVEEQSATEKVFDTEHNPWWQHLSFYNDTPLLFACPHFGQWTDGRSYSAFHRLPTLKKVEERKQGVVYREDILLCRREDGRSV